MPASFAVLRLKLCGLRKISIALHSFILMQNMHNYDFILKPRLNGKTQTKGLDMAVSVLQ